MNQKVVGSNSTIGSLSLSKTHRSTPLSTDCSQEVFQDHLKCVDLDIYSEINQTEEIFSEASYLRSKHIPLLYFLRKL